METGRNMSGMTLSIRLGCIMLTALALALFAVPAQAQEGRPLAEQSSFRIGNAGVPCRAQYDATDARLSTMFDRAYSIACRDAASAVGSLLVLRTADSDPGAMVQKELAGLKCAAPRSAGIEGLEGAQIHECVNEENSNDYVLYALQRQNRLYLARGLKGYRSALELGLASVVKDRPVAGVVDVATTSVSNPAAFARVRAGQLDANAARVEAYQLNNSGSFSEASEYFETLAQRESSGALRSAEFLANQALQESNLGNFAAADSLFARASAAVARSDGVTQRLIRNFQALHQINQNLAEDALQTLARPVATPALIDYAAPVSEGEIVPGLAEQINRENNDLRRLSAVGAGLSPAERAEILDGQSNLIAGSAHRLAGDLERAGNLIRAGLVRMAAVRGGRVGSTAWIQVEAGAELALISEALGDQAGAESALRAALDLADLRYPGTPLGLTAQARLASFLARTDRQEEAIELFDEIVENSDDIRGAASTMKYLLAPYFALLADTGWSGDAGEKAYHAAQLLQRPGVAQTQAIFARELSEGNDEAAGLFRLSISRTRAINRTRADIARLQSLENPRPLDLQTIEELQQALEKLEEEQTSLQAQLGEYSKYRVLSSDRLALKDLQKLLKSGESYFKITFVGDQAYAQMVSRNRLDSARLSAKPEELANMVSGLRSTILVYENGQTATYPFDIELSRKLYLALFEGFEAQLAETEHLIYEADGALLQLPPTLLVTDQKSVDDYLERTAEPDGDLFDFLDVAWLGRAMTVSTAVSQRSFADIRNIAPSRASRPYLGLGQNALPNETGTAAFQRTASGGNCQWPLATWQQPIDSAELYTAQRMLGGGSAVLTEGDFTDSALLARGDLSNFRIVHFATHGLVTAPRPECPARPALLTSFGPDGSDGLLSFKEIFDLRLDSELVVLSACDTAGQASASASMEAGLDTGGNYALDGLVRAFTGAGARSVLASHWPVPDDFDATRKLITGFFGNSATQSLGDALAESQRKLMDDAVTSHPYYWAAFALIGDGEKNIRR